MNETPLTPDQAWSLMLIFLHTICQHETPADPDDPGPVKEYLYDLEDILYRLNCDNESMTEWKMCFSGAIGRPFSIDDRYSPDEVFSTIVELLLYHRDQFGIDREALIDLLQSMKSYSEQVEWSFWQKAIQRVLGSEIWGGVAKSFAFSSSSLPYQHPETDIGTISLDQCQRAVYIFLEGLCMRCRERFINKGEGFAKYIISTRVEELYDWFRNYVETYQQPCSATTMVDKKQAYVLMVRYLQRVAAKYHLDSAEMLSLLKQMEADPEECQCEWACWEQGLQDASEGKYPLNYKKYNSYAEMPTGYHKDFTPEILRQSADPNRFYIFLKE